MGRVPLGHGVLPFWSVASQGTSWRSQFRHVVDRAADGDGLLTVASLTFTYERACVLNAEMPRALRRVRTRLCDH